MLYQSRFHHYRFLQELEILPDPARAYQKTRRLARLSLFIGLSWCIGVALLGVLLFDTISLTSGLILGMLALPGLAVVVLLQHAVHRMIMESSRGTKGRTIDPIHFLSVPVLVVVLLLMFASPTYDQPLGTLAEAVQSMFHLSPRTAEDYVNRGNENYNAGDYDSALEDYNQAISLDPSLARAYYNRGNVWRIRGNYEQALRDYNQAISLNPNYTIAYYNRGIVRHQLGDTDGALDDYTRAIELDPTFAEAYNNRGLIYRDQGEAQRAVEDFTQSIQLNNPQLYLPYNNRCYAYFLLNQYDAALSDCDQAILLNDQYTTAYYNRAMTRAAMGDTEGAIVDLQEVLQLDPNYPEADTIRARIAGWSSQP